MYYDSIYCYCASNHENVMLIKLFFQHFHHISYTIASKITVCLRTIEYRNCSQDAAMKLDFHPRSNNSVGILLYYILINPDKLITRLNTTEYGFKNVSNYRNTTHNCLHFFEMNMFANGQKYSADEICGFAHLHKEFRHWLIFWLGKLRVNSWSTEPLHHAKVFINLPHSASKKLRIHEA